MLTASQRSNRISLVLALALVGGALIVLPFTAAVVAIGGGLVLLAMLRWHEVALYALILAVPFGSWFPVPVGVGNLTAVDVLAALLLALWLARMMAHERAIRIRFPPLALPFVVFLFAALLSTMAALSLQYAVKELTKWLEMLAVFLYVANNVKRAQIQRALAVMLIAGGAEAAIGIYQFLFRIGPEGFSLFGRFMRAYGTFEQPNPFAGYLGLGIPIALGIVIGLFSDLRSDARGQRSKFQVKQARSKIMKPAWNLNPGSLGLAALATLSLTIMLAALVMSWSRGAWLGVGAALVVTIVVQSRRAFVLSVIAAFVLTFIILLSSINIIPGAIAERLSSIGDYFGVFDVRGVKVDDANFAIVERMAHWQAALEMYADHPVLGVGIGNYAPVYPAYALPRWSDPLGHAHNYYLNVAAETGTIGFLAYLLLWGTAVWQAWRTVRITHGWTRSVAAGLLGMIVALSIHNAFDNLFVHGMAVQVGIGLGMIAAITNHEWQTTNDE